MAAAVITAIKQQQTRKKVPPQYKVSKSSPRLVRRSSRIARRREEEEQEQEQEEEEHQEQAATQVASSVDKPATSNRGIKRTHDLLDTTSYNQLSKRPKLSIGDEQKESNDDKEIEEYSHIEHWRCKGYWPKKLFVAQPDPIVDMLARKKSSFSLKRSLDGSMADSRTSGEKTVSERTREEKSSPYSDPRYEKQLRAANIYMDQTSEGPQNLSAIRDFFHVQTVLPKHTSFDDHLFIKTFQALRNRNEARVVRDLAELIVPSAEKLIAQGQINEDSLHLIESVNEGWQSSIPITSVRPQPDFSVGFDESAFSEAQFAKIKPMLGNQVSEASCLLATYYMLFPFLTCEVKCGNCALDVADRQNAHSMGIAVRAVVELFRFAGCREQLDRNILAFSISHDHSSVRIYGHYPLIHKDKETYHRHLIAQIGLLNEEGKDRWMSYKFVKAIYTTWAPKHLKRIRDLIDKLPSSSPGLPPTPSTNFSQQIGGQSREELGDQAIENESPPNGKYINTDTKCRLQNTDSWRQPTHEQEAAMRR